LQKGGTRLATASDKVDQLLAHGRWFFPGTPASSTTKTGHHDIAEILLKVALKHQISKQNQSKHKIYSFSFNASKEKFDDTKAVFKNPILSHLSSMVFSIMPIVS
jgi:hypothetical protein